MKKYFAYKYNIIACMINLLLSTNCTAQTDLQFSIETDYGIKTISRTEDGKDMLLFDTTQWNMMQRNTKFNSASLVLNKTVYCCIEIMDRRKYLQHSGIGFSTTIFELKLSDYYPLKINRFNRMAGLVLQKINPNTIQLVFLDEVDWESLSQ